MPEKPMEGKLCDSCPLRKRDLRFRQTILAIAMAMWGVDNIISWVTHFLPGVERYQSGWWMNMIIVGILLANHLWKVPDFIKRNGEAK